MIVSSADIKNNFSKYLLLSSREDIIITKNGQPVAKLSSLEQDSRSGSTADGSVHEKAEKYGYGGIKATYEEFLELTENSEERAEYIDGEIYLMTSPKTTHQLALTELFVIFYNWFQGKKCAPFVAPYDITLRRHAENINIVQPDIMVICDLMEKLNEKDYYMGVPSLVVEILSESTRRKDLVKKLDLYMDCGVQEYWIVNPFNKEVMLYQFSDRNICASATFRKDETAHSFIFDGLTADLKRIFQ